MELYDRILLARSNPIVIRGTGWSFTRMELKSAVERAQKSLTEKRINNQSAVIFRLHPGPIFIAYLLALLRSGVQVLIADYRLPLVEINDENFSATHILSSSGKNGAMRAPEVVDVRTDEASASSFNPIIHPSSGTTGSSKLIGRTHEQINDELDRYERFGNIAADGESVIVASSLAHVWGLYGGLLHPLSMGGEIVIPDSANATSLIKALDLASNPATVLGTPPHVFGLRDSLDERPKNLKRIVTAGAPFTELDSTSVTNQLPGLIMSQVYGMTEVGIISADLSGSFPGYVGSIADDLPFRFGPDNELQIQMANSPYISGERDKFPVAELPEECGFWLCTGDLVETDEYRTLKIVGRKEGVVNFREKKFHLSVIEEFFSSLSCVNDVVALVADSRIEVYIKTVDNKYWRSVIAETNKLPSHMRPNSVKFVSKIPRTPAGKAFRRRDILNSFSYRFE